MTLQILQYNQEACWPSSDALLCLLLMQKQPKHRNLQLARVEKYIVDKLSPFGFWKTFLEAAVIIC